MTNSSRLAVPLTVASVGLLAAALVVVLLGVLRTDLGSSSVLDVPVAAFAWAWILLPPATSIPGIVFARRARSGRLLAANADVLALWVLSTLYLTTLTG